jgi:hypothetical protein
MDEDRRDALRDLAALLTALVFTLGPGLALFLGAFYTVGPLVLGPLDQPIAHPLHAIALFGAFIILFCIGAFVGGTLWLVLMSRFLPKKTMHKWVTYGPQIRPVLRLNLRLLDALYAK